MRECYVEVDGLSTDPILSPQSIMGNALLHDGSPNPCSYETYKMDEKDLVLGPDPSRLLTA